MSKDTVFLSERFFLLLDVFGTPAFVMSLRDETLIMESSISVDIVCSCKFTVLVLRPDKILSISLFWGPRISGRELGVANGIDVDRFTSEYP